MLVSELKKIIDIDSRITSLHQELAALYSERQKYIKHNSAVTAANIPKSNTIRHPKYPAAPDMSWVSQSYNYLEKAWNQYGINIPSSRQLRKGLIKSYEVIADLSDNQPELRGKLGLLLVPPSGVLGQPYDNKYRRQQAFINLDDHLNPSLIKRYQQKKWRLFVIYNDEIPLNLGKAKDILSDKKYAISSHDMRGLGVYEYYAMSLQTPKPMDEHTWTLLLKGSGTLSNTVTSVTFINGQYRFEIDDTDGVFGDERFRPAIEIAAL